MGGFLDTAWRGLGERPDALGLVAPPLHTVPLSSTLPVGALVRDAVAAASLSASLLAARASGGAVGEVTLDPIRIATAVTSERHFRIDGEQPDVWAALSGFWPTSDGWVRTRANYPHHRARLLRALGLPDDTDADGLRSHLAARTADEVESLVAEADGVATALRDEAAWSAHPQRAAVAETPFVGLRRIGEDPAAVGRPDPRSGSHARRRRPGRDPDPRALGLRRAPYRRPRASGDPVPAPGHRQRGSAPRSWTWARMQHGSRSCSSRPTSWSPATAGERSTASGSHPTPWPSAALGSWSHGSPHGAPTARSRSAARFDSIVQAATGIAWLESLDGETPGALPAQALDHSAGYLLAAGITSALRRRLDEGGSWLVETSLARVAQELLDGPRAHARRDHPVRTDDRRPGARTRCTVTSALPAPHYLGGPDDWADSAGAVGIQRSWTCRHRKGPRVVRLHQHDH